MLENIPDGGDIFLIQGPLTDNNVSLIREGKIDTTPLITHRFALSEIEAAYDVFENRKDHVIKAAVVPDRQM